MIIWLTGLSGSGKTTLCGLIAHKLKSDGYSVEWYDSERIREELKIESDFSREGISKNNIEVINKIYLVKEKVDFIVISLITPLEEIREYARKIFGKEYFEIYVKCDKNTLFKRDSKGLYEKTLNGELDNLIGFSDKIPYEEPVNPDLVIETNLLSPEDSLKKVFQSLLIRI